MLSACGTYRYRLWRAWDVARPTVAFVMLNPSRADHRIDDATIARCMTRARAGGYGRLEVVNLYPLRTTCPDALLTHPDALGPRGVAERAIIDAIEHARLVVCAWGAHPAAARRAADVLCSIALSGARDKLRHLGLNKDGSPKHPLYIAATIGVQRFEP